MKILMGISIFILVINFFVIFYALKILNKHSKIKQYERIIRKQNTEIEFLKKELEEIETEEIFGGGKIVYM